jgi:hypothetical protein
MGATCLLSSRGLGFVRKCGWCAVWQVTHIQFHPNMLASSLTSPIHLSHHHKEWEAGLTLYKLYCPEKEVHKGRLHKGQRKVWSMPFQRWGSNYQKLCHVVLCCVVLCCVVLCCVVLCCVMSCHVMLCCVVLCFCCVVSCFVVSCHVTKHKPDSQLYAASSLLFFFLPTLLGKISWSKLPVRCSNIILWMHEIESVSHWWLAIIVWFVTFSFSFSLCMCFSLSNSSRRLMSWHNWSSLLISLVWAAGLKNCWTQESVD